MVLVRKMMLAVLAASVLTVGCSKGYTTGIGAHLAGIAGGNQTAKAGAPLPIALKVERIDENGLPVANRTVTWSVTSGGGSVSSPSTTTGADGQASVTWTLGSSVGTQTVTASCDGMSFTFRAAATQ